MFFASFFAGDSGLEKAEKAGNWKTERNRIDNFPDILSLRFRMLQDEGDLKSKILKESLL